MATKIFLLPKIVIYLNALMKCTSPVNIDIANAHVYTIFYYAVRNP